MWKIAIILILLVAGAMVYYFGFYKKGKINDRDGDFIPDEVEDTVKEVKRRAKNVKKELKDVKDAVKGKKRKGRKPKMPKPTKMNGPK
jgi:hypothetical protein|tara:strand:- start:379 stop:642 length:264 start_codon:yes stop_codon:yes gene_type:complete